MADSFRMWLWGLVGWLLISVIAAVVHHRFHRMQQSVSPGVADFLLRFETQLAEDHPGVTFVTMLPDQFACLLVVDGQETLISLHDAYRHQKAFPSGFADFVDRLVEDIREVGLDRLDDLDLGTAAGLLFPQVRSREWLEEKGCFGDSGLVYRRLNAELVTVYVVDDSQCMVFVCRAQMKRWNRSEEDIHNLAVANLARLDPARLEDLKQSSEPVRYEIGDGYDAARVLLLEDVDGLLVAIPDRDVLWVGSEGEIDIETLMTDTQEIAQAALHPVSPHVFRLTGDGLEVVQDGSRS